MKIEGPDSSITWFHDNHTMQPPELKLSWIGTESQDQMDKMETAEPNLKQIHPKKIGSSMDFTQEGPLYMNWKQALILVTL